MAADILISATQRPPWTGAVSSIRGRIGQAHGLVASSHAGARHRTVESWVIGPSVAAAHTASGVDGSAARWRREHFQLILPYRALAAGLQLATTVQKAQSDLRAVRVRATRYGSEDGRSGQLVATRHYLSLQRIFFGRALRHVATLDGT